MNIQWNCKISGSIKSYKDYLTMKLVYVISLFNITSKNVKQFFGTLCRSNRTYCDKFWPFYVAGAERSNELENNEVLKHKLVTRTNIKIK